MGRCSEIIVKATDKLPDRIKPGVEVLWEAMQYAEQTSGDQWEFAVELDQLTTLGLTRNDFRWLVRKGLVEHQREVTLDEDNGRAFRLTGDLSFPKDTCFILTVAGVAIATTLSDTASPAAVSPFGGNGRSAKKIAPYWDAEARELRIHDLVVKRFKWHAMNQEIVLSAFQEDHWPTRIDDPLPPQPEQDAKRRLSDTIKCLNRKQTNELVHFRGDGTGEGVIWEPVAPTQSNGSCDHAHANGRGFRT